MSAALDLMASLVLEDDCSWGDVAAPFQWEDARAILNPDSPTPYSYLTRARGASKTADLAGVAIAAMLTQAPPGAKCYAVAADRDQGRLLVDSIEGYVARTALLRGALDVQAFSVAALRTGATLDVLAADGPSAWGLRPYFTVADELAQWGATEGPRKVWEAISSGSAKLAGARLVVLTTAGDPGHWSRRVLDHALASELWRVNEIPGPAPWADPTRLAEQAARLPESVYLRLFENRWTSPEEALVTDEQLRCCVTLDGPLEPARDRRYIVGVDVGLKKDATVAAVCHAEREGESVRVVLDRMERWQGSRLRPVRLAEVEDWLYQASRAYNLARIVADPWQAVGMLQRLKGRGVSVEEYVFSQQSVGRLASTLHLLLRDGLFALPDDEELLGELANVRFRETAPGVMRLDHDPDKHDDRALALALAAQRLVTRPQSRLRSYSPVKYQIGDFGADR